MNTISLEGNLIDLHQRRIYPARLTINGERIASIEELESTTAAHFIMPGFIDAHVHVESSMLIPSEFARLAVVHGTVGTVSDPHEIANVCGMAGVDFMIANGNEVPFKFNFGAPSCVPATAFETAGAGITVEDVEALMKRKEILYLSEMMNFPGVLHRDPEVMGKIEAAQRNNKPVDGHAPGLRGDEARQYIAAGISTDHECFTIEEATDKLNAGMKILIREGSAARNFEALYPLLDTHPDRMMLCSDDKHPDSLAEGHINKICRRAIDHGIDLFNLLQAACVNPVVHYALKIGLLRKNDFADFILIDDPKTFNVLATYINGALVAREGQTLIASKSIKPINNFDCAEVNEADLRVLPGRPHTGFEGNKLRVMEALDGQLITQTSYVDISGMNEIKADPAQNLLKIAVVNRYRQAEPAIAFIKNFGLQKGALASSVAHDSHNIVAVGCDDASLARAINLVIHAKGGISLSDGIEDHVLELPVAGLMSAEDGYTVAEQYSKMDAVSKQWGCTLGAPFMTLSFMALLVIPELKLSDKGLFDGNAFRILD